jgi:nitrite reductase (NO-forming)
MEIEHHPTSPQASNPMWLAITVVLAVFGLTIAGVALMVRGSNDDTAASGTTATGATKTVDVEVGEFYVKPASIDVAAGTEVVVKVTNKGTVAHDLKLGGKTGVGMIDPGKTATASLGVIDAASEAWCTVPGHKEAGMVMKINVTGGSSQAAATATAPAEPTNDAKIDFNATPGADWKPFDPALAPAPGGTEHKVTFHAVEKVMEIAPGTKQLLWTFNGQVPGPVLRGKVGDVFTVTLVNDGTIAHSIDFHASEVAWNDEMRSIKPGESLVYQFKAQRSGAWMYHCGTAPVLHHIGNGMYGAVIIDPPNLPKVDKEYVFVQSEFYTGPDSKPGDLTKMTQDKWDAVVFNGYVSQYKFAPIKVGVGERIRAWVVDDGPNENSAFHIVGTQFDTVFKEGAYLLRPGNAEMGGSQTLDLQPSQGGFVEFDFDEPGMFPMVTHKFSNPGKGALGLWQAGDGQPVTLGPLAADTNMSH